MPILTHTDLSVSPICLGTVQYGTRLSEQESIAQLDRYTGAGGNFIDTALVYGVWGPEGRPTSEPIIGKFLARSGKRNQLILSTKGAHPPFNAMSHSRMHPDLIAADLEQSLRHLGTDFIDLYFLHRDDPSVPVAEILGCLNELRRAGKIRYFGCSNWTLARIKQAELWAAGQGSAGFVCNQLLWSLAKINFSHFPDKTCVAMDPADVPLARPDPNGRDGLHLDGPRLFQQTAGRPDQRAAAAALRQRPQRADVRRAEHAGTGKRLLPAAIVPALFCRPALSGRSRSSPAATSSSWMR